MKTSQIAIVLLITLIACTKKSDVNPNIDPDILLSDLKNVQYGSNIDSGGAMVPLLLDVYFPPNATTDKKYPLFVMIHGGGYLNGDKAGAESICQIMVDSGFVTVTINYRLGWRRNTAPCSGDTASLIRAVYRGLQDGNAALRFLMSKSQNYAIDENWVFVGGASAGSNLVLNLQYLTQQVIQNTNPALIVTMGGVNNSGNNLSNTFTIKGICNMWGGVIDSSIITQSNAIPTISFHGTADNVVPYDHGTYLNCPNYPTLNGSLTVHRQLLRYHKPTIVHLSINGNHGPDEYTAAFLMDNTACFFKKIMEGQAINSKVFTGLQNSCQ